MYSVNIKVAVFFRERDLFVRYAEILITVKRSVFIFLVVTFPCMQNYVNENH